MTVQELIDAMNTHGIPLDTELCAAGAPVEIAFAVSQGEDWGMSIDGDYSPESPVLLLYHEDGIEYAMEENNNLFGTVQDYELPGARHEIEGARMRSADKYRMVESTNEDIAKYGDDTQFQRLITMFTEGAEYWDRIVAHYEQIRLCYVLCGWNRKPPRSGCVLDRLGGRNTM
jgi:hypothetical protein